MQAIIHAADIQDRDGGVLLMGSLFGLYPFLLKLYADGGYQGANFQAGLLTTCRQINLEIVKRSELRKFVVLPKRWIVERTIAWLNRCRRLAKCLTGNMPNDFNAFLSKRCHFSARFLEPTEVKSTAGASGNAFRVNDMISDGHLIPNPADQNPCSKTARLRPGRAASGQLPAADRFGSLGFGIRVHPGSCGFLA